MITVPREVCRDLDQALKHEWLVTNGRGSYASSTITGTNTRRYHGLLVAALKPPLGRTVMLAKVDEEVEVNGQSYRLGTNEYPNNVEPDGFLFLQDAAIDGMIPSLRYVTANFNLCKTIWMEHGRDTTYIRYELDSSSQPINLTLLPFCTHRDFHEETQGAFDWNFAIEPVERGIRVNAFDGATPYRVLVVPDATFTHLGLWYWHFQQRAEAERGLDSSEDLYLPGLLRAHLDPGQSLAVIATIEPDDALDLDAQASLDRARARQKECARGARDDFEQQLFVASNQFLVARPGAKIPANDDGEKTTVKDSSTVIAGYHWFGDWGRDTMITLDGLTIATERFVVARDILLTYAQFVSEGMLPNRFPDYGEEPEYNTVDATLWYFHAVDRYVSASGDRQLLRDLFPVLREIISYHITGTRYNIRMDANDALIYAGEAGVQLTWMDAKVGDWVVTPRIGKPVEINALWYNALRLMGTWSKELGQPDISYDRNADRVESSFAKYWYAAGGYLYDVLDGPEGNDSSVRPNQLFALSLPYSAVPVSRARSILEIVERELLTPFGLRTLTPRHPNYRGKLTGDRTARDGAYHNGTVWPWLLGAYIDAHRRAYPEQQEKRKALLSAFQAHLGDAGLGSISECFDGDAPQRAVGCIAQAWSVAEILRAYRTINDQ